MKFLDNSGKNYRGFAPVLVILLIVAIVGVISVGGYLFVKNRHQTPPPGATFSSLPLGPTAPSQNISGTAPAGIFAVLGINTSGDASFADDTYTNPNISGVAPRISWNAVEPQENQFQWQTLDGIFQKATSNGKKVVIIPVAGFDSPSWALQGVQTEIFPRKYGKGAGQEGPLPIPWDQTYLNRWYSFLSQLSTRYGNNPAFVMIGASGPTSVSAEMSLPNTDQDVQKWLSLGYRPSKYEMAWQQTFAQYAKLFPHQHFVLALYPGLPINEQGQVDQNASTTTRQAIIDLGANTYPNQFALQTSGLNASKAPGGGYDIVLSYNGKILTGFQMSTSASNKPAKMGDAANPENALKLSIDKGLQANQSGQTIRYLEIYEPDIDNPDMQSVLAYGQGLLLNGTAPSPVVSASSSGSLNRGKGLRRLQIQNQLPLEDTDPNLNY